MNPYLNFDKMITPVLIKVIFWVGAAILALSGLGILFSSSTYGAEKLLGLVLIALGPLLWRVICEQIIVFFKIHEEVRRISDAQQRNPTEL